MVRKSLWRYISLAIAVAMLVSLFVGCGSDKNPATATSGQSGTTQQATTEPAKTGPSWTWDTTPYTFSMFVVDESYNVKWDTANNLLYNLITKDTGCSVDISSGNADKLNVMIASDSLADVIVMDDSSSYTQRVQLESNDKLWDLEGLIEKYAPDFNAPQSMKDWFRNPNGKWYAFADWFYAQERFTPENSYSSHNYTEVRKDIMDQLGIKAEDFETQDGFINALKKVKDAKVTYKGAPVSPFYGRGSVDNKDWLMWEFAEQFGMPKENPDGTLADERKDPKMLEAAKFTNRLYKEGLLPEDYFTLPEDQIRNKIQSGTVFAACQGGGTAKNLKALYNADNTVQFLYLKPLKSLDGAETHLQSTSPTGWNKTVITKKAEKPDRIIRFFDYMYSDDTILNEQYGPKGVSWNMVDGHVQYTDQYNNDIMADPKAASTKYGIATFSFWTDFLLNQRYGPVTQGFDKMSADMLKANVAPYIYNSTAFQNIDPDAGSDEDVLFKKIDMYVRGQFVKMMIAKSSEEIDALFAETGKKMDDMGWQKVMNIRNQKFQANKTKLGIKFAWPGNK